MTQAQKQYVKRSYRPRGSVRNAIQAGIRLTPEVVRELDALAAREERSRTSVVERLIRQALGFSVAA